MIVKPSIVEVFEYYGLRIIGADRGGWRKSVCPKPDHQDQNPSASINEDGERWWCHACNEGGDGLDVIMERESFARLADAQSFAKRFAGEGDGDVRGRAAPSSLLPRATGHRPGRRNFRAPWLGI